MLLTALVLNLTAATAVPDCSRAQLAEAVELYVDAQQNGAPSRMRLADQPGYIENGDSVDLATGIISKAQNIDFHRSLLDEKTCETFTEVIITDPRHPYVLGTRLALSGGKVKEIETLVTDQDDWLFSANNYLKYSPAENWGLIPAGQRSSRKDLIAAANAYLDLFMKPDTKVPWGVPCARLEGGIYTAKGLPEDHCNIGIPKNVPVIDRRFIVDETIGSVVALVLFGNNRLPDSHLFRLEKGKYRYIHTLTMCKTFNCGFPVPEELRNE